MKNAYDISPSQTNACLVLNGSINRTLFRCLFCVSFVVFCSFPLSSERCREERKDLSIEIDRGVKDGEQVVFRLMAEQVVLVDEIGDRAIDVEIAIQISRSIGLLLMLPAIYHLAIGGGVLLFSEPRPGSWRHRIPAPTGTAQSVRATRG
jgi:hypothetical protein